MLSSFVHFSTESNMDTLIAHVEFDQETGTYTSSNKNSVVETEATLSHFLHKSFSQSSDPVRSAMMNIGWLESGLTHK